MKELHPMKKILSTLRSSKFLLAFYSVAGGSVLAQILNFAFQPVVSRLYSVEQFGEYTVYTTTLSVVSVIITLSYDQAVIAARNRTEAQRLLFGTIYLSAILSALFALFCILCRAQVLAWMKLDDCDWLLLLPLNMFLLSSYTTVSSYNYILEKYRSIGAAACIRSAVIGFGQILLFFVGAATSGLAFSQILALIACSGALVRHILSSGISLENARPRAVLSAMKDNKQFPLFQMPATFVNHFVDAVITFALLTLYSRKELGLYSRVVQTLSIPISLISSSLYQLFVSELAKLGQQSAAKALFRKLMAGMSALIFLPMAALFLFGEPLFVFVFGAQWSGVGIYIKVLALLYSIKFVAYPLSGAAIIVKRQNVFLLFQVFLIAAAFLSYVFSSLLGFSSLQYLLTLNFTMSLVYIMQTAACYRMLGAYHK